MELITQPWARTEDEVFDILDSAGSGISEREAEKRLAKFGENTFHNKERASFFLLFLKQFGSPLIFLLLSAALITAILTEWVDTAVILLAVFIDVILGFYHEFHAENTLEKLTTYIKDRTKVVRQGTEAEIDSALVVPGDVLKLAYGSRVPADARIITHNDLHLDEAILTGESVPVEKNSSIVALTAEISDRKNVVHAGTLVVGGYGSAVVYATGNNTEIGKIAGIVSGVSRAETPLQKGMKRVAWIIFASVLGLVGLLFILGISKGEHILPMLVLSSAVAVGAVPESLPIAITMILAVGATRIASKKGVVRKLSAAETLGSTTLIMTDKTGTLTLADMQLVGVNNTHILLGLNGHVDKKNFSEEEKELLRLALDNIDVLIENPEAPEHAWVLRGKPFEVNIVRACLKHGVSVEQVRNNSSKIVLPFNSTNKFSVSKNGDKYTVMGAPDVLLGLADEKKSHIEEIEKWIKTTSEDGKRLIGLAEFRHVGGEGNFKISQVKNLKFRGVLVFHDPVRENVPKAVADIEAHGVRVVLLTGDLPGTAISVARLVGWEVGADQVLLGSEIRKLKDDELRGVLKKIKIFARVTPEDKLRIGRLYQELGEIVAMTGDGVNDAPALKAMDIGISLGTGTDVAKAAADLVLLDDNFETIAMAITEGRKILGNVRKTFIYLMSNSLDEVFIVGGSLIFNLAVPLTALQIIWVNLVTGSLPALAFAFDQDIDHDRYTSRDLKKIFTRRVNMMTFGVGVLSSVLLFVLYYFMYKLGFNDHLVRSVLFVCFSSYILAVAFSFRSLREPIWRYNPFSNKKLNLSVLISAIMVVITMTVPKMRELFNIAPLPGEWIPFIVFWLLLNLVLVEVAKIIFNFGSHRNRKIKK